MPKKDSKSTPRFDPRVALIAFLVVSVTVVASDSWIALAGAAGLLGWYMAATGVASRTVLKSTASVGWFLAAAMAVFMLTVPGRVLLGIGDLYITAEGVIAGLMLSARLMLLVWLSTAYVQTVPLVDTMDGIASLLQPITRGRGNLLVAAGVAVAFVPLMIATAKRVKAARTARGEPEGRGFIANARFAAAAAVPLFAAVFRSADELAQAMEARCFDPSAARTSYASLKASRRDWILAAIVAVWTAVSFVITFRSA